MDIIYFVVSTICLSSALSEHQTSKCHGNNYMNSMCSDSGVIAIRHLQYGAKSYINQACPSEIEKQNNDTCCSFENGDCLKNITDYIHKYLYFSRLSRLTSISQNTATPWTRMECGNRTFSNYVLVSFDCIKESEIKNFCSYQKLNSMNGSVYLSRKQYDEISDTCECSIKSSENSIINVNAVDVRLQPKHPIDQNHTGECSNSTYKLTFSNGSDTVSHECENSTIFGEFTPLYSSSGNWVNISYSEGLSDEPQSVWLQVTVSKGEFEIECNPRLSTTSSTPTTTVHSTISGGQGNRVTNKRRTTLSPGVKTKPPGTKKPGPDIHNSGPSARVRERAVQNTVLYAVFAVSIIAAILIIVAGVFIRRVRRSGKRQRLYKRVQEKLRSSDSTTFSLQTLPRENSTNIYPSSTDQLY